MQLKFNFNVLGSIIVILPNMLIMFLFRQSRPFIPPRKFRQIHQRKESIDLLATTTAFSDKERFEPVTLSRKGDSGESVFIIIFVVIKVYFRLDSVTT